MSASTLPARAVIREVGLRDGLQAMARTLPTEQKKAWLRGAHAAGLGHAKHQHHHQRNAHHNALH